MTTEVSTTDFHERVREKIREATMGLLTDEVIDKHIEREFNAFFNDPTEVYVLVERSRGGYYGSGTFGLECSPFRVMVWTALNEYLKPKLNDLMKSENSRYVKAIDEWLVAQAGPIITNDHSALISQTMARASTTILQGMMRSVANSMEASFSGAIVQGSAEKIPFPPVMLPSEYM